MDEITVNEIEYVRKHKQACNRAVVVVDRGWVFAGDVVEEEGRIRLARALHVFSWTKGFSAMISDPKDDVDLRPCADVDIPCDAEIFRVPVGEDWGL